MTVCVKVRTRNLPLKCMLLRLTNRLWQLFSLFDSHSRSLPARAKTRSKKHSSFFYEIELQIERQRPMHYVICTKAALDRTLFRYFLESHFRRTNRDVQSSKQTLYLYGAASNQWENVAFCYSGDDSVNPGKGGKKEHCVTMLWCYVIFQRIMNSFQRIKVVQDYPTLCLPS